MSKTISTNNVISNKAVKGAATGAFIGCRTGFGPPAIVVGLLVGGILGFILDED
jgi:hypothetical protein